MCTSSHLLLIIYILLFCFKTNNIFAGCMYVKTEIMHTYFMLISLPVNSLSFSFSSQVSRWF